MSTDQITLAASPLIQPVPKAAIHGALSLSRYRVCDGATLVSTEPLSIKMPQQQWAYGILFPLDHGAFNGKPADALFVLQVKLVVEGGSVGVAACNADGSAFTSPEAFVSGTAEIRMTLTRPTEPGAFVVRQAAGNKDVCATILEIGLFEAGEERLAPRRHDLGYDLFVILAPGKTGTHTIESAVYALSPLARVHRVHYASAAGSLQLQASALEAAATFGADYPVEESLKIQAETADRVRADIATVRRLGGSVAFLTAVREPIARAVAGLFQSLPLAIPVYLEFYAFSGAGFAQALADRLVAAWDHEIRGAWPPSVSHGLWSRPVLYADFFDDEFRAVTGFDVLLKDFNTLKGYARLDRGADVAVVFRTSELDRTLSTALSEITGHRPKDFINRNVSAKAKHAPLYHDVVSRIRVPAQLAEAIYRRHAYMTHFFDQNEIDDLVRRWSCQGFAKLPKIDRTGENG